MKIDYPELIEQFVIRGKVYAESDLNNPLWVFQEIARLGYSISLTTITLDSYLAKRSEHGLLGEPDMVKVLRDRHVLFSYQLLGPQIETRGAHPCPILEDPQQALLVALFNIIELYGETNEQTASNI